MSANPHGKGGERNRKGVRLSPAYPDGLERVPPRFAISARNRWMVEKAQFVVTYTVYSAGGAAQFSSLAKKKGKTVINLADVLTKETTLPKKAVDTAPADLLSDDVTLGDLLQDPPENEEKAE